MNGLSTLKTGIQALVKEIDTITLISEFWVKVAVYWGVCTWGHDELNKFPVLRFVGDSESGKSELT